MAKFVSGFGPGKGTWTQKRYDLSGRGAPVKSMRRRERLGDKGGILFSFPPGWTDGSGKIKHIKSGPYAGRVYFTSRKEAKEIAKRYEGTCGDKAHYDPD